MTPVDPGGVPVPSGLLNLGNLPSRWVGTGRIAFVDLTGDPAAGPMPVSYDELADRCARIAGWLQGQGYGRSARIGILADNSVDYAACYLGIMQAGMVAVPLNTRQPPSVQADVAADAALALVFHDADHADRLPAGVPVVLVGDSHAPGAIGWGRVLDASPVGAQGMEPDEVAVQMYTSGSTGRPKGVLLTHGGQLFSIHLYVTGVLPMEPDERLLVSAPMYHKNAGMQLKMALSLGGTVILLRRFTPEDYLRAVAGHRATAVSGVPTMFALMAGRPDLVAELDLSGVRRASIGSAPMTQALFDQARRLFPNAIVTNGYGTTEVVAVFGGHPEGRPRPDISVGHPLAAVETRLVDPATGADAVADPATGRRRGELWVRSPGLMSGYHNRAELTAERVTDGWYHTGDVMEADADGWHFVVGRVDDMFNCGGENVYPGDVEQMLERCPLVHQAGVVAVPDEVKGALPVAFVVATPGQAPTENEVKAWALANGPAYQHPRAVWVVDELPLASTVKLDKTALAAEARRRWVPRPG
ncbi:MAG: acyl--CoA ligase [Acidimicrobiia bacterium]|nr:acyl--CoA ligase [Acidimicrobiia bacterium]